MAIYDAFVSYSHAKDKPVAAALQAVIQTLGKPWYRRRALRVFRDDTSLSATPALWPAIEQALSQSRYLVLLASPEAAASPWVNKEIAYWLEHNSAETLLIALTDGTLTWDNALGDFVRAAGTPLPSALAGRFAVEPKWVDLTAHRARADARDGRFIEAGADFAATIRGMPKEDLLSQEVRQQRRALRLAWSAAVTLLLLGSIAGWQWWEADRARQVALAAERSALEQREAARQQRDAAQWQRERAEQERGRAERNYAAARATVNSLINDVARGLRNVEGLRGETIARVLDTVKNTADQLAKTNPDDPQLDETRRDMFGQFTATYMTAGDRGRALQAATDMLSAARRLAEREPSRAGHQRSIASAQVMLGTLYFQSGNDVVAEISYREAVDILRELGARVVVRDEWRKDLAFALDKIVELRDRQGDVEAVQAASAEVLEIRRAMVARAPSNSDAQYWLSVSLDKIGKLKQRAKAYEAAATALAESLAIIRRLAARDPSTQIQRDLALSLRSNADLSRIRGRGEEALTGYEESLAIERRLARLDPDNAFWQRGLGTTLDRIGMVRQGLGDAAGARAAYEEARDVFHILRKIDPRNLDSARSLIIVLSKLGTLTQGQGDRAAALAAYRTWLDIAEQLAAAEPGNPAWRTDMVQPLYLLARLDDDAPRRLGQARAILNEAAVRGALTAWQQSTAAQVESALAALAGPTAGGAVAREPERP